MARRACPRTGSRPARRRREAAYDQNSRLSPDLHDGARRAGRNGSGHRAALGELGRLPRVGGEDVAQRVDGVPDVDEARIERREAEAQHVGLAVVADHAARDQRLHDFIAVRMLEARLRAALVMRARRDELQRQPRAARFDERDERVGQRQRLAADRLHVGLQEHVEPAFDHRHRHDRLRAAQKACDARVRRERRLHRERRAVAPPAGQRLREMRVMAMRHPHERRRAGAAVQVFVRAADRAVGTRAVQVDRHRAGGVGEIPQHQRARVVRELRDGRHVVHVAGAVVHVRDHRDGRVVAERGRQFRRIVDQTQLVAAAELLDQPLRDVQVGREIRALGHDHAALRRALGLMAQHRRQQLEQVDRDRVGHDRFAGCAADQRRELVAEAARQREPAGGVPAADQAFAPFGADHLLRAGGRCARLRAERIAVEIDHAVGQRELAAQRGERIVAVEGERVFTGLDHDVDEGFGNQEEWPGSARSTARTGLASSVVNFSGSAISS